jgi:hypothetical protein
MNTVLITIEATIDPDSLAELTEQGYTTQDILRQIQKSWVIGETPKPICDAEIKNISCFTDGHCFTNMRFGKEK